MRAICIAFLSLLVLLPARSAPAQDEWIGVYSDADGQSCRIDDNVQFVVVPVYIVHHGSSGSAGSRFRLVASAGMTMTYLSANINPSFLYLGDVQSGIQMVYVGCKTSFPILLATVQYLGFATTPACEWIDVDAAPDSETGLIESLDCSSVWRAIPGSRARVNPNLYCLCSAEPDLAPVTTVSTNPPGLSVTVDGVAYEAPQSFEWVPSTTHTIGTTSPQGPVDSVYTFSGWSDGGAQTHIITAQSYDTQFTATFSLTTRLTLDTSPTGLEVVADGQTYTAPKDVFWPAGSQHNVSAPSPQPGVDSAYVFASWSDGGAQTHDIFAPGAPSELTAYYSGVPNFEPGYIGVFADGAGSSCELTDNAAGVATVYVIHRNFGGATQSRFRVRPAGGFTCTYIGESSALTTSGDTQLGIYVYYPGCETSDLLLTQVVYLCAGTSAPCAHLFVAPAVGVTSGTIEALDCSGNLLAPNSGRLYVNPDGSCQCGEQALPSHIANVTTEPPGLVVEVDGVPHSTPVSFSWLESSVHTVTAAPQQANYLFLGWSDGGDATHDVEMSTADVDLVATYYGSSVGAGVIGLYTDTDASSCDFTDGTVGVYYVELIHTGASAATASQFRIAASAGVTMTLIGTAYQFGLQIGDIQTGVSIAYIGCQTPPLHLATLTYFAQGTSSPCSYIDVLPHPDATTGSVEFWDCASNVVAGTGGRLTLNGDGSCPCGVLDTDSTATVTTTPAGIQINVDGTPYTSPAVFSWTPGSVHPVSAPSNAPYGADTILVFSHWSDGGAREHSVTMPPGGVTFRATYDKAYHPTPSGVEDTPIPAAVTLLQNSPNPFNPTTRIEFSLPSEGNAELDVFDVGGRRVRRLYDGPAQRGFTSVVWDGTDDRGRHVASGVYFYRLRAAGETVTRKMVLLK